MSHFDEKGNAGPMDIFELDPELQGKDYNNDCVIDTDRKASPQLLPIPARTQRGPGHSARNWMNLRRHRWCVVVPESVKKASV